MQPYYLMIIKVELKIIPGLRVYVLSISFPLQSRGSTAHLSSTLSLAFSTFTCVFIIPTPQQEHGRSTVIILSVLLTNSTAGYPRPAGNLQLQGTRRASALKTGMNWDELGLGHLQLPFWPISQALGRTKPCHICKSTRFTWNEHSGLQQPPQPHFGYNKGVSVPLNISFVQSVTPKAFSFSCL